MMASQKCSDTKHCCTSTSLLLRIHFRLVYCQSRPKAAWDRVGKYDGLTFLSQETHKMKNLDELRDGVIDLLNKECLGKVLSLKVN